MGVAVPRAPAAITMPVWLAELMRFALRLTDRLAAVLWDTTVEAFVAAKTLMVTVVPRDPSMKVSSAVMLPLLSAALALMFHTVPLPLQAPSIPSSQPQPPVTHPPALFTSHLPIPIRSLCPLPATHCQLNRQPKILPL